jgi:hypothetical protein
MASSALLINYTLQYKRGRRVITTFWYFLGSHVIQAVYLGCTDKFVIILSLPTLNTAMLPLQYFFSNKLPLQYY